MNKYLQKRAINGPWQLLPTPKKKFKYVIIIPSLAESKEIFKTLTSIENNNKKILINTLVIIVINNSSEEKNEHKNDNKKTLQILLSKKYSFTCSIIDAFTTRYALNPKYAGVGLARKIGMDLSLPYLINDKSLLFSLDADTIVNNNYLEKIIYYFNKNNLNAAVVGFKHSKSKNIYHNKIIKEYESILIKTAEKIKYTGSPYGYVAMGSTMVCTNLAYVAIGGMPKKKATEDFYFLQELAKYCGVYSIPEILVYPSPRVSNRVYLGTGYRMSQIIQGSNFDSIRYSSNAFNLLKYWIQLAINSWGEKIFDVLFIVESKNKYLKQFIVKEGIENIWDNLHKSSPSKIHFIQQFHRWFDGLKTIKFLKYFTINN